MYKNPMEVPDDSFDQMTLTEQQAVINQLWRFRSFVYGRTQEEVRAKTLEYDARIGALEARKKREAGDSLHTGQIDRTWGMY